MVVEIAGEKDRRADEGCNHADAMREDFSAADHGEAGEEKNRAGAVEDRVYRGELVNPGSWGVQFEFPTSPGPRPAFCRASAASPSRPAARSARAEARRVQPSSGKFRSAKFHQCRRLAGRW